MISVVDPLFKGIKAAMEQPKPMKKQKQKTDALQPSMATRAWNTTNPTIALKAPIRIAPRAGTKSIRRAATTASTLEWTHTANLIPVQNT